MYCISPDIVHYYRIEKELILFSFFSIILQSSVSAEFTCSGLSPGYYADMSSSCSSYLLCMGSSMSRGMKFSCPQGTKFQQRTLVCDHAHSVDCQNSYNYFRNNLNIWETNKIDLEEEDIREKREKKIGHQVAREKVKKVGHAQQLRFKGVLDETEPKSLEKRGPKIIKATKVTARIKPEKNKPLVKKKNVHFKSNDKRKVDEGNMNHISKSKSYKACFGLRQISECRIKNNQDRVINMDENKTEKGDLKQTPIFVQPTQSVATEIPNVNQKQLSINSIASGAFNRFNKSLDKIPFSRVVGVQSKTGNSYSPFISFSSLVSLLTKSSTPVRMIPVAVTSKEAELIRSEVLKGETLAEKKEEKEVVKHGRHPRLIKQIYRPDSDQYGGRRVQENIYTDKDIIEEKQVDETVKQKVNVSDNKHTTNQDYQLIYKSANTADNSIQKQVKTSKNVKQEETNVKVEPRGSSTGFSRRKKFPSLPPVTAVTSEAADIMHVTYIPSNSIYFDPKLDTLQAPSEKTGQVHHNINVKRNIKRLRTKSVRKQDRKSNLDFLGIFDTRKYFFIPQNRRSEENSNKFFPSFFSFS